MDVLCGVCGVMHGSGECVPAELVHQFFRAGVYRAKVRGVYELLIYKDMDDVRVGRPPAFVLREPGEQRPSTVEVKDLRMGDLFIMADAPRTVYQFRRHEYTGEELTYCIVRQIAEVGARPTFARGSDEERCVPNAFCRKVTAKFE